MPVAKYNVTAIDANTYAIEEKTPINQGLCYLLCGQKSALLIDTGFGFKALKPTVERLTSLPVIVANTHAHVDHIGGNHLFCEIWYHEADREVFALHTNPDHTMGLFLNEGIPLPLRVLLSGPARRIMTIDKSGDYHYFKDGHTFDLGGREVEVVPTPGHTPGSVCFLDRGARQLFSGDTVCEWGILLHFEPVGSPDVYLQSVQRLKARADEFDAIWPGHHGFPVEKSYLEDYEQCAQQLVSGTATMETTNGHPCGKHGRVLISIPQEVAGNG